MLVGLIMSDQWVQRHAKQAPEMDFEVFAKNLAKGTPLGRIGTAEEFASMACFLASKQGSYITGPPSISMAAVRRWCSARRLHP